jgi:hypothetical protein
VLLDLKIKIKTMLIEKQHQNKSLSHKKFLLVKEDEISSATICQNELKKMHRQILMIRKKKAIPQWGKLDQAIPF